MCVLSLDIPAAHYFSCSQFQDTPPHTLPPTRGPQREKSAKKLTCIGDGVSGLWKYMWTAHFTNPSTFKKHHLPLCVYPYAYWHNGKFPTLLPEHSLYQAWTLYLNTPAITLFNRTVDFRLTTLQLEERYLCYWKCKSNLTFWQAPMLLAATVIWQCCSKSSQSLLSNIT